MRAGLRLLRRGIGPAALLLAATPSVAAEAGGAVLPGSSGKEPISIDAAKLDYFNKEGKLVYSGEVVARQGTSTLKGSMLTIYLSKEARKSQDAEQQAGAAPGPAGNGSITRMEVAGPVTVISKDEVGTGDNGSYDKAANRITLTGNVTLTQAANIIKGDKLVYDMNTGQAQVMSGHTAGRVRSVFTPASGGASPAGPEAGGARRNSKPAPARPAGKPSSADKVP